MVAWRRMGVFFAVTVAVAVAALIYYRVGVAHLFPMIRGQFSGPFTSAINLLDWAVPLSLVILELGTAAWALSGGVQREAARRRVRR